MDEETKKQIELMADQLTDMILFDKLNAGDNEPMLSVIDALTTILDKS